jgi:small subunit ribosomal protein S16
MATAIRLRRGGRTHSPYYRIVVIDSRNRDRGPEIDNIGIHHPCARPEPISEVDAHKALTWLRKGAQPSDTAKNILRDLGVMKHFHDGTDPEEAVAQLKGGAVADKGFNAPPPPKEDAPEPKETKAEADDTSAESTEEVTEETSTDAPEAAEDTEEKTE